MRVQTGMLVPLGYGKYVRSERVSALMPIEDKRGPGRRTFIFVDTQTEPLVASRAEDSIVRDLVCEPREVTRTRQHQEILRDLLDDLETVNDIVRDIVRDRSQLDLNVIERRAREALEEDEA